MNLILRLIFEILLKTNFNSCLLCIFFIINELPFFLRAFATHTTFPRPTHAGGKVFFFAIYIYRIYFFRNKNTNFECIAKQNSMENNVWRYNFRP